MDVERYYNKAFLELPCDEKEKKEQIDKYIKIIEKVENMMKVDTKDYEIFELTSELSSPLREDEIEESSDREVIFNNTNHREYGYFKLDNIMEDKGGYEY